MKDIVEPFDPCATQKCKERCEIDEVCHSEEICLEEVESLRQQLAECQAREKVLRDALQNIVDWGPADDADGNYLYAEETLKSVPFDSTALDEAIKASIEDERQNPWKMALMDGLVITHTLCKEHETDPRKAVNDLISWHVTMAEGMK